MKQAVSALSEVDILIVGGGPSGLLAASKLANRHRVALIEKESLGTTSKFWVTTDRRLRKHDLDHCVLHRTSKMVAGTFLGGQASAHGDFVVVDDQEILGTLVERCRERGVRLIENCSLLNIRWTDDRVQAVSTGETFSTRLLADATGGGSPIAKTFRLHRIDGFYSIYGCLLEEITLHMRWSQKVGQGAKVYSTG